MKINFIKYLLAVTVAGLALTSCEDDGGSGGTGTVDGPAVTFTGSDVSAVPGDTVYVSIDAVEGDSPLRTLTVLADGSTLSEDQILINGSPAASNPILFVSDADKVQYTAEIGVIIPSNSNSVLYEYQIADEAGEVTTRSIVVNIVATPPTFEVQSNAAISSVPGVLRSLTIKGTAGSVDMASISVSLDGTLLPIDDLEFGGVAFLTNPSPLEGDDRQAFEKPLLFRAPATAGTYTMTFAVIDAAGNIESSDITLLVGTTPVTFNGSIFWNADGQNNGGLDLDNGDNVPSTSGNAEILDEGIDSNGNWFRSIRPNTDVDIYTVEVGKDGITETFSFEGIQQAEQITAIAMNATESLTSTGTVEIGDIFVVTANNREYIFIIRDLVDAADNDDYYVVDIKVAE